jgi:hypothetical protein
MNPNPESGSGSRKPIWLPGKEKIKKAQALKSSLGGLRLLLGLNLHRRGLRREM